MGITSGAGTTNLSRTPEFTQVFSGVHVALSLVFSVVICRSFSVLFLLAIVLSVLQKFFDLRNLITPLVSSNSSYLLPISLVEKNINSKSLTL